MTTTNTNSPTAMPKIHVAPSPHIADASLTTRSMMVDVLIALAPVMIMAVLVFQWYAITQVGVCVLTCVVCEAAICMIRGQKLRISDYSAAVTGIILGLSLPWSAPWYIGVIASMVAVALGKEAFGGLGYNLFNPAMVGRAFVMLSFASSLGAGAYVMTQSDLTVVTQATPLSIAKQFAADLAAGNITDAASNARVQLEAAQDLWGLFIGQVNGSLGETSALALLIGGVYLCLRKTASWQIPLGIFSTAFIAAAVAHHIDLTPFTALRHLISGSLLFGAFYIATDPVTSPLTPWGKFIFGMGIGFLTVVFRLFSGYPEGVMFAVLLMNAAVPLINRWTIPTPLGGPTVNPEEAAA